MESVTAGASPRRKKTSVSSFPSAGKSRLQGSREKPGRSPPVHKKGISGGRILKGRPQSVQSGPERKGGDPSSAAKLFMGSIKERRVRIKGHLILESGISGRRRKESLVSGGQRYKDSSLQEPCEVENQTGRGIRIKPTSVAR